MALVLLGLIGIDAFLLSVTIHQGLRLFFADWTALHPHILWGLFAILFTCLIHSMSIFYFVGTGKDVANAIRDHADLKERYGARLAEFKWEVHPYATFASIFMIAVGALGAASHYSGAVPAWIHFAAAMLSLVLNAVAFFKEYAAIHENRGILAAIDKALYKRGVRA